MTRALARDALGYVLRERRTELGLTQVALAKRADLTQSSVARLETSDTGCTMEMFWRLAAALRLTRAQLFARVELARQLLMQPKARALYHAGRTHNVRRGRQGR